jgi:hypothetical protein
MALISEWMQQCGKKVLDNAGIVRDSWLRKPSENRKGRDRTFSGYCSFADLCRFMHADTGSFWADYSVQMWGIVSQGSSFAAHSARTSASQGQHGTSSIEGMSQSAQSCCVGKMIVLA